MRIASLKAAKKRHKRWVMLTAYDALTAELLEEAGVDWILVGDSVATVLLGYSSTREVRVEEMVHHARAVRRGARRTPVIGDLPLKGVAGGPRQALATAKRFLREGGCDAVKLEWAPGCERTVRLFAKQRIPFMGHVGLTPQRPRGKHGLRVQGQTASEAVAIFKAARFLEEAGAFAVLLECVPSVLAREITRALKVPTIGIGAGPFCDGQVLVFHDMVGLFEKLNARFIRRYARLRDRMRRAVRAFAGDVRKKRFPKTRHSFRMRKTEWRKFKAMSGGPV